MDVVVEMAYFRSYWSHLDISTTICPYQMAAVGFEPMTLGFLTPIHCTIGADPASLKEVHCAVYEIQMLTDRPIDRPMDEK